MYYYNDLERIMKRVSVSDIYKNPESFSGKSITVAGWSRSIRASNVFGFIELNDGSCFKNLQIVFEDSIIDNYKEISSQNTGASFVAQGPYTHARGEAAL